MSESQADLHNRIAGTIVRSIVEPIIASGGSTMDILVLAESVALGALLYVQKSDKTSPRDMMPYVDLMMSRLKERIIVAGTTAGRA